MRMLVTTAMVGALAAAPALGGELVLPAFAWKLAGKSGNLWTSELVVTNPGREVRRIVVAGLLPGREAADRPCLPPLVPLDVPAESSRVWSGADIARDLGCPAWAVGGLRLITDGPLRVTSRMVNEAGAGKEDVTGGLLTGYGQEIVAEEVPLYGAGGAPRLLPGLAWHPNACGPPRFETYVVAANPGESEATVWLSPTADGSASELVIDGRKQPTPAPVTVPAGGWRQLHVVAVDSLLTVCRPPVAAELLVTGEAGVLVMASVVDRTSQDPRTVTPVPLER